MDDFLDRLCDLLDVGRDRVPVQEVLDLARDAAHGVERPAAPVTTFVAGLAAGLRGGSAEEVGRALRTASDLAVGWSPGGSAGAS